MAVDFSESQIDEMYGMYQEALEGIGSEALQVVNNLCEVAQEVRYEPVVELSKKAVEYYNEDLQKTVLDTMREWQEGDDSFAAFMDKMRAGDAAERRSKELEAQIADSVEEWPRADDGIFDSIDTTNWHCDVENFEEINALVNSFVGTLETERGTYADNLENRVTENTIYVCIQPVILGTFSIVAEGFTQGINESFKSLAELFSEREQEAQKMGSEAAQGVAAASKRSVAEGANAIKDTVRTIFE